MAIPEQNKYIQFVNLLNRKNFFENIYNSVISPLLNCICVITKQKDGFLYFLPNCENSIEPFWQCNSKVQRCLFSDDGKNIFFILNVNSFQIYTVAEKNVSLLVQLKASVLTKLLHTYNIDFSAATKVDPLKLKKHELIIMVDKKLILNIEWSFLRTPTIRYLISLESHNDFFVNDKFIFLLHDAKVITIYNVGTGEKCNDDLNSHELFHSASDISIGHNFFKISVHSNSKTLAVVNESEEIILFEANDFASEKKTISLIPVESKKEKWSWPYKSRKSNVDTKTSYYRVLGKVSPPSGLVVCYMQFSLKGLFAFYCILGQEKCSCFKVIDERSAAVLYSFDGLVESKVLSGGPLPLVMTDSILSICLGVLCNDYFIIKLCEVVPNFGFSKELERTLFSQAWIGGQSFHLVFLKIILNLHLNIFYSSVRSLPLKKNLNDTPKVGFSEKKIMERILELFKVVEEYKDENVSSESNIKQDMLVACFLHAVRLLDLIQVETKGIVESDLFSNLLKQIIILFEYVRDVDPLKDDWITWLNMSNSEIIQEAVVVGAVALAHVFFVTNRDWSVEEVETKFKSEAHSWIINLISMNDLEKAKNALANLGCDPIQHLKSLCLNTNDQLLREVLVNHLLEIGELTDEEKEAWVFNKKIENALSAMMKKNVIYEQKMNVSAKEKVNVVAIKLPSYKGSLDLDTILKCSKEWRDMVLTEVYFNTGDVSLEDTLEKDLCWRYLLEANQIDLLKSWIEITCDSEILTSLSKSCDYLFKSFYNLFSGWPVTENMLDLVYETNCMTITKNIVLDTCAFYGFFSSGEKSSLRKIINRLENNSVLCDIRTILSKPASNVTLRDFDEMIFTKCIGHSLKPVILVCLNDVISLKESQAYESESFWIDAWNLFHTWQNNRNNKSLIEDVIRKSSRIYNCTAEESSYLDLAVALVQEKEILDVIEAEGKECSLLQLPLVEINWQAAQTVEQRKPDVTLYDLLKCSNVPVDKLFLWQSQNKNTPPSSAYDMFYEFPHFNHQVLGIRHGFRQNLDYIYYLRQGRPSFACNLFVVESLRTQRRLTTKMIKRVCGMAHGLALRFWKDTCVGSACVAFIAMLGDIASANCLRIHLAASDSTYNYLNKNEKYYISTLIRGIVTKEQIYIQEMASLLESAIMTTVAKEKSVVQLEKWYLAVSFCNIHNLPLPTSLLKHLARKRDWFSFVLCLDIFKYPYEQAIELIEEIDSKILKSHLIRALTRTTLKLSTTSPNKSPPKILLEPESNGKDDFEMASTKENKDVFQSFVTNIYTEVLNTIQTFTDKNIVLPWSCEQDPDNDVLLTLLKCESEPDTSKALLISSIELQSPVLAVLATCFQSENIFPNLIAWLLSSIPTSMSRMKRREEGQQLVDRNYSSKEMESLLLNFFSTGYFQTFFRGMNIFLSDNPLTIFFNAMYRGIVLLDFPSAFELLKEFVVEITHYRLKEPPVFFSKTWILNLVVQCLGNLLTRSDLQNSTKRQLLRLLADSDLASVDASFPNYLLWSQICEILESSETNLDFIQLYDPSMVSQEIQNSLDNLTKNFQFSQALEICSLLSLNKDKCVLSMWKYQLDKIQFMKSEGGVRKLWTDSSVAFKDENVSPTLAASFYHDMASNFQCDTADSVLNRYYALKYCLHWRRLIEDTLTPAFREESDSIELEMWKCCIQANFDANVLTEPVDLPYSLLLSVWSATKVLIRSHVLSEREKECVENLINMFLDREDLQRALRLSAFFKSNNQDLITITSCLKVIHGELTPSDLSKLNATVSATSKKLWFHGQYVNGLDLTEYEMVPSKEQHQMLFILDKLCQTVKHGRSLAKKILVCFRLSVNLDSTFKDIASERDYLSLLPRSVALEGVNKFNIASDLIILADLPCIELAKFLKDKIVSAIMEVHSTDLMVPVTLWDVALDSDFHMIINLMDNPSLLGSELLQASINLPCNSAVEVLIRAHDCFTASCNVEGIGRVLRRARILASLALQEEQWQHLVRLLIGIERYTDLSYIFQMLKDNGQFEQLLRKGMHKIPGLHVAISEFLQRYCPQDRELSKMVAAHFNLHSKLAALWQEEADEIILKLPVVDNILKDSSKTRTALHLAMDNYSHAVHWFLQAGKLNRALKLAHQAQMVALQISLLGGAFILRLQSPAELQTLVNENLSVAQTMLVSRAYDLEPDWIMALHERWVLKGDKTFYTDLKASCILSPQLIQKHSVRYDIEQVPNAKAKDRMKQLLTSSSQQLSPLLKDLKKN